MEEAEQFRRIRVLALEGRIRLSDHWLEERQGKEGRDFSFMEIQKAISRGYLAEESERKFRAVCPLKRFRWLTVIFLLLDNNRLFVKTAFASGRGDQLWFKRFRRLGKS